MATTKKASIPKEVFSTQEEEILSRCSPFPLAQKKKAQRNSKSKVEEIPPSYWANAFKAMGEDEAAQRLETYKSDIRFLVASSLDGDQNAMQLLYRFAEVAIRGLEHLADHDPRLLHPTSMYALHWPALIGNKKIFSERNGRLLKTLKLAEKSPLNHHWNPESQATFTAHSMLYWLTQNQSVLPLPPLDKDTIKIWFEWGWRGFSHQLDGSPEKYPHMRELVGKHAEKESARKQEKRKTETVIRTKMRDAVRQSFLQLLKNIP